MPTAIPPSCVATQSTSANTAPAPGSRSFLPNIPFNQNGQLYAVGGGLQLGKNGLYIENHLGGMEVEMGNAQLRDGKNTIRLWNAAGSPANSIEVPVRPSWTTKNDPNNIQVGTYLSAGDVARLGLKPGDCLAMQPTEGCADVTVADVLSERQVFPGEIG
jgi:hypothetical protein